MSVDRRGCAGLPRNVAEERKAETLVGQVRHVVLGRQLAETLRAAYGEAGSPGRGTANRVVAWATRRSLELGQSRAAWGRFWQQLRRGRVWHPALYWDGLRGSILLGRDVATAGWLFLVNLTLET